MALVSRGSDPYARDLDKDHANFIARISFAFFARSASVYPDHPGIFNGTMTRSWRNHYERCRCLTSARVCVPRAGAAV
jgi:3-(methylthio)propionyl---CoA ligase